MSAAPDRKPIRRALISVYDKSGLPELVAALGLVVLQHLMDAMAVGCFRLEIAEAIVEDVAA